MAQLGEAGRKKHCYHPYEAKYSKDDGLVSMVVIG